jgi:hypothetical protein
LDYQLILLGEGEDKKGEDAKEEGKESRQTRRRGIPPFPYSHI